ncbi:MAG: cytochrome c maturation protein CcmE [Melioribacteraceae bacterium]|nr:cytochrome c maturation protein CcmE [Melioribacteraceae bacterium]
MQKIILPILLLVVVTIIYFGYFSPTDELGSFSSFDTNNTANREIIVKLVAEKGFQRDVQNNATIFYVLDKNGVEVMVSGPSNLPPGMDDVKTIVLRGHLHDGYFHASEVITR